MKFVVVMESCVVLAGIIYRWNVFTVLAVICIPYLASSETGVVVKNSWVKIIETSRNLTRGNANITLANQKEGTSHVKNINNSWNYPGNESRHIAEDNVNKTSVNPGKIVHSEREITVNTTPTNRKDGTSHMTGLTFNNSWIYPGNASEVTVNKDLSGKESSRIVTKANIKNNSRTFPDRNNDVAREKVNNFLNKVISSNVTKVSFTKITTNSSQNTDHVVKLKNSTSLNTRSPSVMNEEVHIAWDNSKSKSRNLAEVTLHVSTIGPRESSHTLMDEAVTNSGENSNSQLHSKTEDPLKDKMISPNEGSYNMMDKEVTNSWVNSNSQLHSETEDPLKASKTDLQDPSHNVSFWTNEAEGSAHGGLLDILGVSDDEDNASDGSLDVVDHESTLDVARSADSLEDDGGGGDGEAESAMVPDVNDTILVTCFRCHGDGINGCDVTAMLGNASGYSVMCNGKCLNVSSGNTAVYDCAHDMQTQTDTCLQNDDTKICFCTGSFCNGPSLLSHFNLSSSNPFLEHLLPPELDDYDYEDTNSSDEIIIKDSILTKKTGYEMNEGNIHMKKDGFRFDVKGQMERNKNGSNSYLQDLFAQNNTRMSSQDFWQLLKSSHQDNINYIISENISDSLNSSTTKHPRFQNAIGISDLRVGKLKDSLEMTKNGQLSVNDNSFRLLWVICSLLTLTNGL